MNLITFLIAAMLLSAFALCIYGAFVPRRSLPIAIVAVAVLGISLLGAWYAWMETQSLPWAAGYLMLSAVALIAFVRQLLPSPAAR